MVVEITKSLMVQDNIKDKLILFFWTDENDEKHFHGVPQVQNGTKDNIRLIPLYKSLLTNEYSFIMYEQYKKMEYSYLTGDRIIKFIQDGIDNKKIPERYKPKIKKIDNAFLKTIRGFDKKKLKKFSDKFSLYQISFDLALVSLLEQNFSSSNNDNRNYIIAFFKLLNKNNGIEFNEYIDNWADKLLKEIF